MLRLCKVCGETKDAAQGLWKMRRGKPRGLTCSACTNTLQLIKYHADPDGKAKARATAAKLRATPEGRTRINKANKKAMQKILSTAKGRAEASRKTLAWARNNPDKVNAITRRRQAAKLSRTPVWLTPEDYLQITSMYTLAHILTACTGAKHVVDHIIPLQGRLVSGLHVPYNLQVITVSQNSIKGNSYDPA